MTDTHSSSDVTKDPWTQVRIEFALMQEVDKVIQRERVYGARKYFSRSDFVKDAVLRLLKEYDTSTNTEDEEKEEEILVTGK
jgi:metal-responsive CopG/Arc/MetJ family transcriptional regulator